MRWEKRPDKFEQSKDWRVWFAWYPVVSEHRDGSKVSVWLERVWRRRTRHPRSCPEGLECVFYIWEYMEVVYVGQKTR